MAASPTPRPAAADLASAPPGLRAALDALRGAPGGTSPQPSAPLAVAFSGGADSTALLRAACLLHPGRVIALHVHHGLQAAADDFARHCERLCDAWQVPLRVLRVRAHHAAGDSPEDAARRARYAALAAAAREAGAACVWLGQHADDQVETVLLALSRGAGLPGLAAMPGTFVRESLRFERPLLAVRGPELRQWLEEGGIAWVEDPTNAHEAFTRNRIRRQLLPALEAAFPQFRDTFARSARHAAQAQALLAQVADEDLRAAVVAPDAATDVGAPGLRIAALQALTRERQANLVRHWLRTVHGVGASAAQLDELLDQVSACRTRGHRIHLRVGPGHVRRVGEGLAYEPERQ